MPHDDPNARPDTSTILSLWQANAAAWTAAVRGRGIESRRVATDGAVVAAVLEHRPARVLDVGCGEGWLARALGEHGITVHGVDAVPALVASARAGGGGGTFEVASIADLAASPEAEGFNLWVCNFSLFHERDAPALVAAAARRLPPHGRLVVQTLHATAVAPAAWTAAGTGTGTDTDTAAPHPAADGWQPGGWGTCGPDFGEPIPWYFRSTASWRALLLQHGFTDVQVAEPAHPDTGRALSLLLSCGFDVGSARSGV